MKPKDLILPPLPENGQRPILLLDQLLYLPRFGADPTSFVFPGWESEKVFARPAPVAVEYCSGNGAWIIEKAKENPQINWVAVEMKGERVRKIWSKMKNEGLRNLFIVWSEARLVTENFFSSDSVESVYINFPDPWPKKKHAKNRLIQDAFVKQIVRILTPSGALTFVTDDLPYGEEASGCFIKRLKPVYEKPYYILDMQNYGSSYFESLWREKGRNIHTYVFNRIT